MTSKPTFTKELWNELWKKQKEREAQERDRIRQLVATSEAPLTPELVQVIVNLNGEYSTEILREHPGFVLAERRSSYLGSLQIMNLSLDDLLASIANFEQQATAENATLFNYTNVEVLEGIKRRIQKELFATANAAASLVDHSRRVRTQVELPDYDDQLRTCFGANGLHDLVIGLRVLLHRDLCITR